MGSAGLWTPGLPRDLAAGFQVRTSQENVQKLCLPWKSRPVTPPRPPACPHLRGGPPKSREAGGGGAVTFGKCSLSCKAIKQQWNRTQTTNKQGDQETSSTRNRRNLPLSLQFPAQRPTGRRVPREEWDAGRDLPGVGRGRSLRSPYSRHARTPQEERSQSGSWASGRGRSGRAGEVRQPAGRERGTPDARKTHALAPDGTRCPQCPQRVGTQKAPGLQS